MEARDLRERIPGRSVVIGLDRLARAGAAALQGGAVMLGR